MRDMEKERVKTLKKIAEKYIFHMNFFNCPSSVLSDFITASNNLNCKKNITDFLVKTGNSVKQFRLLNNLIELIPDAPENLPSISKTLH